MENASRAFLEAVQKSMRQIRASIGAATINPSLLTAAERTQYEGYFLGVEPLKMQFERTLSGAEDIRAPDRAARY